MNKFIIISIFFLSLVFTSCDIQGRFTIRNKTKGEIAIKYYIDKQDSIVINQIILPDKNNINECNMILGLGQFWTGAQIKEYISDIQKIEIITPTDTTILENKTDLYQYFKKRRKGILKNEMRIDIN